MVFARSRRPTVALAVATFCLGGLLAGLAAGSVLMGRLPTAIVLGMAGAVAVAAGARQLRRLLRWPTIRLGFFRDRLLLTHGAHELQITWSEIEVATLAAQAEWGVVDWPAVRLTDRLTLRLRGGGSISIRPATLGLGPVACRDLVLRFRDDRSARLRLPVYGTGFSNRRPPTSQPILPDP